MSLHDRFGLSVTAASAAAVEHYVRGVDLMLSANFGADAAFEAALAADPDFALAHIGRARIHTFYQQGDVARAKAATARETVARHGTPRERSHVETLALAIEGRVRRGCRLPARGSTFSPRGFP